MLQSWLNQFRKIYFDDFSMRSLSLASAQKSALFMAVGGNPPRRMFALFQP
jgi:hypothetical protein